MRRKLTQKYLLGEGLPNNGLHSAFGRGAGGSPIRVKLISGQKVGNGVSLGKNWRKHMDNKIVDIRTALQKVFGTGIEEIAQEKGFVQRLSKLTGLKFVEIWVMGFLEKPSASLNYLVQVAADLNIHITKQGLQDRLSRGAVDFLMAVLERCMTQLRNKLPPCFIT
jgi:hypothetical protein